MVTRSQTNFIIGCAIGVFSTIIGNHWISLNFVGFILQLEPRVVFDGIGMVGSIATIILVFRLASLPNPVKYGLGGFTIPFSIGDFVFLMQNAIQITHS